MHYGNLQKIRDGKRTYAITPDIPGGFVSAETLEKIAKVSKKYNGVLKITSGQRILITNLKEEDLPHIWIPGGFVSAETLEKIAKVSKKYNGVLKITSGQRILITNLKEEDLPHIWNELGMEPAVLKANSVKNVEICPAGFCKRSKYNTIGIGMKLTKKYSKQDMPCRTKIGVAGCRNSCGSVYAKDVGVIADVTGLMVVAGGSAGFNPRIADIIAKGLDETQTLKRI